MPKLDKFQLLSLLADGKYHSGQELAEHFSATRSAVWNCIKSLESAGIPLNTIRGRGYQIPHGIELLSADKIIELLPVEIKTEIAELTVLAEVDSTNDELLKSFPRESISICLAECQYKGRGRFGRRWQSPLAANIYCSMLWQFDRAVEAAAGLSIVIGIAIAQVLQKFTKEPVKLKWPNDIIVGDKKLGGILIELSGDANGPCHFIIGMGINVRMPTEFAHQQATDLFQLTGRLVPRNELTSKIISNVIEILPKFSLYGLDYFQEAWRSLDAMHQKQIQLDVADKQYVGVANGIDNQGNLILAMAEKTQHFNSGVATVMQREL